MTVFERLNLSASIYRKHLISKTKMWPLSKSESTPPPCQKMVKRDQNMIELCLMKKKKKAKRKLC